MTSSGRINSTHEPFDRLVASLAAGQHGAFSRAQLLPLGATPATINGRLATGRWEGVHRGVYHLAGVPRSWRGALMAACLACGPDAVVSHRSAGTLLGIADSKPRPVELTVPRDGRRNLPGAIVHRSLELPRLDVTSAHAIPVTTPTRTLLDLASVLEPDALEEALDAALRTKSVSLSRLRWRLDALGGSGRMGAGVLRSLIDAREPATSVAQSVFEARLLRAMRRAGLPEPVLQYEIRERGRLLGTVDFAYPDIRLAIEADGYRWHTGRLRFDHDLARRNALTALGWHVMHVTWTELTTRPDETMRQIERTMRALGGLHPATGAGPTPRPPDHHRLQG